MADCDLSVVVPTGGRPDYLDVTLTSLLAQRDTPVHELLVVDDGPSHATKEVAARHGVRVVESDAPGGLNAARNTGIRHTSGELISFVDDDVRCPPGWLAAMADGGRRHPDAAVLTGPIRPRLEGPAPRACGREYPPITALDLGTQDTRTEDAWGANLTVRRSSIERFGPFDVTLPIYGDEEAWVAGVRARGGFVVYVAAAGLDHRRAGDDARLRAMVRAEWRRGRALRGLDERKGQAPTLPRELRNLAGAVWHTGRRRCALGIPMTAHALGRLSGAARR